MVTFRGIHNQDYGDKKRKMDALDQERVRLDSRNANLAGNDMGGILQQPNAFNKDGYIHQVDSYGAGMEKSYPNPPPAEAPNMGQEAPRPESYAKSRPTSKAMPPQTKIEEKPKGGSYMEQKREELRLWKMQQEQLGKPPMPSSIPQTQPEPQPQVDGGREERKLQMERELAEQMAKMNMQAPPAGPSYDAPAPSYDAPAPGPSYDAPPAQPSYQAPPAEPSYQPPVQESAPQQDPYGAPGGQFQQPLREMPPRSNSIRRKTEEGGVSLVGGYGHRDFENSNIKGSAANHFETSAMSYGNPGPNRLCKSNS